LIVEPGAFRTDFFNEQTSHPVSDIEIDEYKQKREKLHDNAVSWHQNNQEICKTRQGLMTAITAPHPPLPLVGNTAVDAIDKYLNERCLEFDAWREVSVKHGF